MTGLKQIGLIFAWVLGWLVWLPLPAMADTVSVYCTSPTVMASDSGDTYTANLDCTINAPDADNSYRITPSNSNFVSPSTLVLSNGFNLLLARRKSTVSSPDGSVTSISGNSSGFTARVSNSSTPKTVRFQYSITTNDNTPQGLYTSLGSGAYYQYQICTNSSCNERFSGTAPASISIRVAPNPVTVSCASPTVNATPGGGPFSLTVVCTATGGPPSKFSPSSQNRFSPSTIVLSRGAASLSATLQNTVTSPDNSVTSLSGTASGGFSGNVMATPAKVQVQYTGTTTSSTPGGSYTSTPVSFIWSTL